MLSPWAQRAHRKLSRQGSLAPQSKQPVSSPAAGWRQTSTGKWLEWKDPASCCLAPSEASAAMSSGSLIRLGSCCYCDVPSLVGCLTWIGLRNSSRCSVQRRLNSVPCLLMWFSFLGAQMLPGSAGRLELWIASFTEISSGRVLRKPANSTSIITALPSLAFEKMLFLLFFNYKRMRKQGFKRGNILYVDTGTIAYSICVDVKKQYCGIGLLDFHLFKSVRDWTQVFRLA